MTNKVRIDECEPKVMENFLEFLYTDQLEDPTGKTVITVQRVTNQISANNSFAIQKKLAIQVLLGVKYQAE